MERRERGAQQRVRAAEAHHGRSRCGRRRRGKPEARTGRAALRQHGDAGLFIAARSGPAPRQLGGRGRRAPPSLPPPRLPRPGRSAAVRGAGQGDSGVKGNRRGVGGAPRGRVSGVHSWSGTAGTPGCESEDFATVFGNRKGPKMGRGQGISVGIGTECLWDGAMGDCSQIEGTPE